MFNCYPQFLIELGIIQQQTQEELNMKYSKIIIAMGISLIMSSPVFAQAVAGSQSASGSISGAQAGAVSLSNPQGGSGVGVGGTTTISFDNHSTSKGSDLSDMVPQVYVAPLTNSISDVCFGSGSGGISGAGFGASFAKTYIDDDCVARLDSRELANRAVQMNQAGATELGLVLLTASFERLCSRPEMYAALARVGKIEGAESICSGEDPTSDDYDRMALRSDTELDQAVVGWFPPEDNTVAALGGVMYGER